MGSRTSGDRDEQSADLVFANGALVRCSWRPLDWFRVLPVSRRARLDAVHQGERSSKRAKSGVSVTISGRISALYGRIQREAGMSANVAAIPEPDHLRGCRL